MMYSIGHRKDQTASEATSGRWPWAPGRAAPAGSVQGWRPVLSCRPLTRRWCSLWGKRVYRSWCQAIIYFEGRRDKAQWVLTWPELAFHLVPAWTLSGWGHREATTGSVSKACGKVRGRLDFSTQQPWRGGWGGAGLPGIVASIFLLCFTVDALTDTPDRSSTACHPPSGLGGLSVISWVFILCLRRCFSKKN